MAVCVSDMPADQIQDFSGRGKFFGGEEDKNIEVFVMKLVCLSRKFDCQHKISFFHF